MLNEKTKLPFKLWLFLIGMQVWSAVLELIVRF